MWKYSRTSLAQDASMDADEPSQADADVSQIAERAAALHAALDGLRPEFEVSSPRTVGGVPSASAYVMLVPFASPCEVSVVSVTNTDSSAAATVVLSLDPNLDLAASNAATMTTTLDGNQGFLFLASVLATSNTGASAHWFPLQAESAVYVRVNGAGSKAAYVTLQFRRRINAMGVQSVSARG